MCSGSSLSTVSTALFPLCNRTLHLPGSWEMLRDSWEGRPLGPVLSPCPPSLPNSFTLPHCHCLPHRGPFHPNGDGRDPPAPSWPSPLSCPLARGGPKSIRWGPRQRSQGRMSPRAEDAGRAARIAGCGCQMFLSWFLFSQTPRCKLSNTVSAAGSPRFLQGWLGDRDVQSQPRVCWPPGSHCVPLHTVRPGPGLSVHCANKLESYTALGHGCTCWPMCLTASVGDLGKGKPLWAGQYLLCWV